MCFIRIEEFDSFERASSRVESCHKLEGITLRCLGSMFVRQAGESSQLEDVWYSGQSA